MTGFRKGLLIGVVLSASATSCRYLTPGTRITADVAEGSKFCGAVRIPNWDSVFESYRTGLHGAYRKPSNGSGLFLFSVHQPDTGRDIAVSEKYWLDPEHRTITAATDADWEGGTEVVRLDGSPELKLDETRSGTYAQDHYGSIIKDRRDTVWRGRHFSHTGDIGFIHDLAPGDRFIALSSFDGYSAQGRFALADWFYIDVFDVSSGKRLAFIKGFWKQWSPDAILLEARWLSDRDLVFPFGEDSRDLIVCRF